MLHLRQNPTIKDFQEYAQELEKERGFDKQTAIQKGLLLGEEIGELFKAMRKQEAGLRVDLNSKTHDVADELADVFIYLCAIANRYDVDLEQAFRAKEEKNKARVWK
jgi:NTP pyrophosphatase (non-canonical NTP hydrolase)